MNNFEYLYESYYLREGDWSSKYHYFYKEISYKDILEISNDRELLYKILKIDSIGEESYNRRKSRNDRLSLTNDYFSGWEEKSKDRLQKSAREILSYANKPIYRALGLDSKKDLDLEDLGVCWAYDKEGINHFSNVAFDIHSKPIKVVFIGETDVDNIDWAESILLHDIYPEEHELRIKDPNKIFLKGIEKLEDFLR